MGMLPSLLMVDDDPAIHSLVEKILLAWNPPTGCKLMHAQNPAEALRLAELQAFHIAFIDLHYSGDKEAGFRLLESLRILDPKMELIVLSSSNRFESVQQAMRSGANDFVAKGFGSGEFLHVLTRALERRRWKNMERDLRRKAEKNNSGVMKIIGKSLAIDLLREQIRKVAMKPISVLIEAETGCGKELVARSLHDSGEDPSCPFVAVDCGAVPTSTADSFFFGHEKGAFTGAEFSREGVFEQADAGTLFLDEINSLSLEMQAKLLRVLQEKEFRRLGGSKVRSSDFRLLVASNGDLQKMVQNGSFREDLFYRINVMRLAIPPLRERAEDIELLATYFLPRRKFSPELIVLLKNHSWPGNIRELKNVLTAMDVLAEEDESLATRHIPEHIFSRFFEKDLYVENLPAMHDFEKEREEKEKDFLAKAYRSARGNVSEMSRVLGMDRSHLHQKLIKLGIHTARK